MVFNLKLHAWHAILAVKLVQSRANFDYFKGILNILKKLEKVMIMDYVYILSNYGLKETV